MLLRSPRHNGRLLLSTQGGTISSSPRPSPTAATGTQAVTKAVGSDTRAGANAGLARWRGLYLQFAACATRRAVDQSEATAVRQKACFRFTACMRCRWWPERPLAPFDCATGLLAEIGSDLLFATTRELARHLPSSLQMDHSPARLEPQWSVRDGHRCVADHGGSSEGRHFGEAGRNLDHGHRPPPRG